MKNPSLLYLAFGIIALMGALHFVGSYLYLYWTVWWFDYLMHFLAGLGGGLAAIWLWYKVSNRVPERAEIFMVSLAALLVVGVAWEIFEYVNGIAHSTEGYVPDTFHDLLMDLLGAGLAGYIGARALINREHV